MHHWTNVGKDHSSHIFKKPGYQRKTDEGDYGNAGKG